MDAVTISHLIDTVFSVTGFALVAAIGAIWLARRPASASARRFLVGVVSVYVAASVFVVPYAIDRLLALGYHPFAAADAPSGRTAIVLLGAGGVTTVDWTEEHYSLLERVGAARVLEAVRVFHLLPDAVVIASGGVGSAEQDTDSVMMRAALLQLGVPDRSIVIENESQNTRDEAIVIKPMLARLGATRVVLVTSDFHMRRSMAVFRASGIDAVPAIARDPRAADPWNLWVVPTDSGLGMSRVIVHEVLGIVYYAARGWARF